MHRVRRRRAQEHQTQQELEQRDQTAQDEPRRDWSSRDDGAPAGDMWSTGSPRSSFDSDLEKPVPSYHPERVPESDERFVGHSLETFLYTTTNRVRV